MSKTPVLKIPQWPSYLIRVKDHESYVMFSIVCIIREQLFDAREVITNEMMKGISYKDIVGLILDKLKTKMKIVYETGYP